MSTDVLFLYESKGYYLSYIYSGIHHVYEHNFYASLQITGTAFADVWETLHTILNVGKHWFTDRSVSLLQVLFLSLKLISQFMYISNTHIIINELCGWCVWLNDTHRDTRLLSVRDSNLDREATLWHVLTPTPFEYSSGQVTRTQCLDVGKRDYYPL